MTSSSEKFSDVLIIGGGVIGLAVARELHKRGVGRITVLERGKAGQEASHAAAGMLSPQAETDRFDDFFRFCEASNRLYPGFAGELLNETGIDIELDPSGTICAAFTEEEAAGLRRRFESQQAAGLAVEHMTASEVRRAEPFISPDVVEGLFFPNDRQVENRRLVEALVKYAQSGGIDIREGTTVTRLVDEKGRVVGAEAGGERFFASATVIASGAWTSLIRAECVVLPQVRPIRGQMIAFHTARRLFRNVIYGPRGYLVPRRDGRILIGATIEDVGFDKRVTEDGIRFLRETAFEIAPSLVNLEIAEKWSGLRPFASDGRPVIGELAGAGNLFVATAHYRNGILLAPLTARILTERITGRARSDYLDVFGPQRFLADGRKILNTTV